MEDKYNQLSLEQYSRNLAKLLSDRYFASNETINGQQLITFSPVKQINLFVIKELLISWNREMANLKSPYFDFEDEEDLKLCWNFTNLRLEPIEMNKTRGQRVDVIAAKAYFKELHDKTGYPTCLKLLDKIHRLELSELRNSQKQLDFILKHKEYLEMLEDYSPFEFEMLNRGRTVEEVNKEIALIKKLSS